MNYSIFCCSSRWVKISPFSKKKMQLGFMHECDKSQCAVWVKNWNVRELNFDEQFSETRVEKWLPKTTSITARWSRSQTIFHHTGENGLVNRYSRLFYFLSATRVYFMIKLAQATGNQVDLALLHSHFQFPLDSNSRLKTRQLHFLNFMLTLPSHPNRCIHVLQRECD